MGLSDIQGRIKQANGRLKSARIGVQIEMRGERLSLRATLPPKPGTAGTDAFQQRISLKVLANPAGVSFAEREARKVGGLIATKSFDWTPYMRELETVPLQVGEWVKRFELDYFSKRDRTPKTETTWRGDYLKVLRRLPADQPLTVDLLQGVILGTQPDSKTRKRTCMVLGKLAALAGLQLDARAMSGRYSPSRVTPRDLPDDAAIAEWFFKISNPAWRWVYGVIATYGLRPHEAFHLDMQQLVRSPVISILEGKTGPRRVWPCYPEWVEQFELQQGKLPGVNLNRSNQQIGESASRYFWEFKLPFRLYDLRHCWAIRTLEFGLPVEVAAQQMGHSVAVHCQTYHHWITDQHHQRVFDVLMLRSDRPKAPIVAAVGGGCHAHSDNRNP